MLDLKEISLHVRRLGGLQFPPTTPEGWKELSKVLARRCLSMDHVERVIDRWLETEDNCPTPAQLGSCASRVPADPTMDNPVLAKACPECEPDGMWTTVSRVLKNGDTVTGMMRCTCPRGRQLASLDAIRAQAELSRQRKGPGKIVPLGDVEGVS